MSGDAVLCCRGARCACVVNTTNPGSETFPCVHSKRHRVSSLQSACVILTRSCSADTDGGRTQRRHHSTPLHTAHNATPTPRDRHTTLNSLCFLLYSPLPVFFFVSLSSRNALGKSRLVAGAHFQPLILRCARKVWARENLHTRTSISITQRDA